MIRVPEPSEYAPYYTRYISLVPAGDIVETLDQQCDKTRFLLSNLDEDEGDTRYAPGKWTVKEVLGHIIDTERIMSYRALRISRNDKTPLPSFEQDDYIRYGPYTAPELTSLLEEFHTVRRSTMLLFTHLSPEAWDRTGTVADNPVSVRALAWIIAGHEIYHRKILKEKYLGR
jgi:hypothetical protein